MKKTLYYRGPEQDIIVQITQNDSEIEDIVEMPLIWEIEGEPEEEELVEEKPKKPRKKRAKKVQQEETSTGGLELSADPKKQQIENVVKMLKNGIDVEEIEKSTGMSKGMIYYYKRKNHIGGRQKPVKEETLSTSDEERITDLWDMGKTEEEISASLGFPIEAVKAVIHGV